MDFLIVDRDDGFGIRFAVEFDGPYHDDPERAAKDRIKEKLCFNAKVPLIRVGGEAIGEREQITALEWIVECFWIWKTKNRYLEQKVLEFSDRYGWPVDPGVALHCAHPFPGNEAVRTRLRSRYGIWSELFEFRHDEDGRPNGISAAPLSLMDLNDVLREPPDDHDEEVDGDWELHEERPPAITYDPSERPQTFHVGVYSSTKKDLIYQTEVPIRWSQQSLLSQVMAVVGTGTWLWAVDLAMAEYAALIDIERWADRHLIRIDH